LNKEFFHTLVSQLGFFLQIKWLALELSQHLHLNWPWMFNPKLQVSIKVQFIGLRTISKKNLTQLQNQRVLIFKNNPWTQNHKLHLLPAKNSFRLGPNNFSKN